MHSVHMETPKTSSFLPFSGIALTIFVASMVSQEAIHPDSVFNDVGMFTLSWDSPLLKWKMQSPQFGLYPGILFHESL